MSDIKNTVAKNLIELRLAHNLTQLELAEKLNYSDKAISKWEHGSSMPDLEVLVEIADMYGVTLDYLVSEDHPKAQPSFKDKITAKYSRTVITLIAVLCVWFIALLSFVLITLIAPSIKLVWLAFVYAVPVTAIVWLVLNSIWFNQKTNYLIISLLMWSAIASIHITCQHLGLGNVWLLYLLGIPSQAVILLWSFMKKKNK